MRKQKFKSRVARAMKSIKRGKNKARVRSFTKARKVKSMNYARPTRGGFRL